MRGTQVRRVQAAVEAGRAAAFNRDFEKAAEEFSAALAVPALQLPSPLATAVLAERAAARLRLKDLDACIADCEAAIAMREDCKSAYVTRASAQQAAGLYDAALAGLSKMAEMDPTDAVVQKHLAKAQFEVRKAKRPDYYGVLGAARVSTPAGASAAFPAPFCSKPLLQPSPNARAHAGRRALNASKLGPKLADAVKSVPRRGPGR